MTIIVKLPHVFGTRWTEWLGAMALLFAGLGLLHPYPAFDAPTFVNFDFGPWSENFWGMVMFVAGILRFTALIINGRRKTITPWMRLGGAGLAFMLFLGLSIGLALSGSISTWPGGWPVLAVMEFVNIVRASSDARLGKKYGRPV